MSQVAADMALGTLTLTFLAAVCGDSCHSGCGQDEVMCGRGDMCDCEGRERGMVRVSVWCGFDPSWRHGDQQGAVSGEGSDLGDHNPHYHSS